MLPDHYLCSMEDLKVIYLPFFLSPEYCRLLQLKVHQRTYLELIPACRRPLFHPKSTRNQSINVKTEWASSLSSYLCFNVSFSVSYTSSASLSDIKLMKKLIVVVVRISVNCKLFLLRHSSLCRVVR